MRQSLGQVGLLLFGSLVATSASGAHHSDIVAQSGDAIPGEAGRTFQSFAPPVLVDGMLAFPATDDVGVTGIGLVVTDGSGSSAKTFKFFRPNPLPTGAPPSIGMKMSLSADSLIVDALTAASAPAILGIKLASGSAVSGSAVYVVQVGDPMPGSADYFQKLDCCPTVADKHRVIFQGDGSTRRGIYTVDDLGAAGLKILVDNTMSAPDGSGLFTAFGDVDGDGEQAVFQATSESGEGVYAVTGAVSLGYVPIANKAMKAPGSGVLFESFGEVGYAKHAKKATFVAQKTDGGEGIYATQDFESMKLFPLADTNTPLPDGAVGQKFLSFESLSHSPDGKRIAFIATGTDNSRAIYTMPFEAGAGALKKVMEGSVSHGKKISELGVSRQALGSLGYLVDFEDGSSSVLFEPDTAATAVPVLPRVGFVVLAALALVTGAWSVHRSAARRTAI